MNGISDPFIKRPIGTSLLALGILLIGIVAFNFLPVAPLPKVDFPTISVSVQQPGVDPKTAASSLAAPLEKRFSQIAGVSELTSVSSLGGASITIQFDLNRDINGAARDVQSAINAAAGELPSNLPQPPSYRKINPADAPIMILSMTSDTMPLSDVYNMADQIIGQRLSQVDGVSQVQIGGGAKSAVRVQVNPLALASIGLSVDDIRNTLTKVNADLPKGSLDGSQKSYILATNDRLSKAADYIPIIVRNQKGSSTQLGNLATVIDSVENNLQSGVFNGKRAVLLIISKQSDANVVNTVSKIREILPFLQRSLPPGIKLLVQSDRTRTIHASVDDVELTLVITIVLVVLVMFLFLRKLRPTFIAGITIPLSLSGTFGIMWLCGYTLDNLSLMALTISTGFVVDDAIVVIENIVRLIEEGETPMDAAIKGARQIGFTVISISLSLVAVFIPLLFMGGLIGRLFHEFAITLSATILISGVVSLTLTPMLCALFLKREKPFGISGKFFRLGERVLERVNQTYARGLRWVLQKEWLMLGITAAVIAVTIALYVVVPKGFFPQQDTGQMIGITEAAQDVSFTSMREKQIQVVKILGEDPAIDTIGSFFGGGAGSAVNTGRVFITLKPKGSGRGERIDSPDIIIARIRRKMRVITGINLFLQPSQDIRVGGRASKAAYQYVLQDSNILELNEWAPKLLKRLSQKSEIKDVNTDQQYRGLQENVVVDRNAASRLGIQPEQVDDVLYSAFGQRQVSVIYTQQNQFHVVLEVDPHFQSDPSFLDKIYLGTNKGKQIPLSAIAHFELVNTALSVNHQGQFPAVTISFNLAPGLSLSEATRLVNEAVKEIQMPSGIRGSFAGTAQVFQASLSTQPMLLLAALVAVYIVLGVLYESLIHPLTILSTLPSAGLGALLAIIVTGGELSLVSTIGIILLIGIVKKNAIMIVDFAIEAERNHGVTAERAIYEACLVRFRPIMMTTFAAMFGAIPLAFGLGIGSEIRKPLGVAIVGGLLVSQILTLYTTPVIYLFLDRFQTSRKKRQIDFPTLKDHNRVSHS